MSHFHKLRLVGRRRGSHFLVTLVAAAAALMAVGAPKSKAQTTYTESQVIDAGHRFFGTVSGELSAVIENAFQQYGEPNGYILGQEGSGAFVAGARYGEGDLFMQGAGQTTVFWQGPSVGWDFGGDGARVMMLVYNLPRPDAVFTRFIGVNGSAYLVGGFGMTVLASDAGTLVPVRSGVGARLGVNVGYLKFTPQPTWNPF